MADGGGECCIARWGGGGHVSASGYSTSKMDMIMLKFRPIAPKPVVGTTTASEGGSSGSGSGNGRYAKAGGRGRKKTSSNNKDNISSGNNNNRCNNNNNNNNNRRKRKSSSPNPKNDLENIISDDFQDKKSDLTLLPLFPEAPDLSPTSQDQVHNMPFWLNFDNR